MDTTSVSTFLPIKYVMPIIAFPFRLFSALYFFELSPSCCISLLPPTVLLIDLEKLFHLPAKSFSIEQTRERKISFDNFFQFQSSMRGKNIASNLLAIARRS